MGQFIIDENNVLVKLAGSAKVAYIPDGVTEIGEECDNEKLMIKFIN